MGKEIHRDMKHVKLWLLQHKYVEDILMKFDMNYVNPINIHLASHFNISSSLCPSNKEENNYMSRVSYASAIGSLIYAMVCARICI